MGTQSDDGLRACMIDGFGAFEDADYRRSWLFFDDVDYVFPIETAGPITMPPLSHRADFTLRRPELSAADIDSVAAAARRDAGDHATRVLIEERVPRSERDYAAILVWSDVAARDRLRASDVADPVFPVLFLANKLIWFAAATGAAPIVGRDWAAELLIGKAAANSARRWWPAHDARRGARRGLRRWTGARLRR